MTTKADALAALSEGWCPICKTPFTPRDGAEPVCGSTIPLSEVRREVEAVPEDVDVSMQ